MHLSRAFQADGRPAPRSYQPFDEESGVEQHGFLNTLAATAAAIDGAEANDVVAVLKDADAERLVELLEATGAAAMRQLYRSFGSCSITEPYEEFAALSLLPGDGIHVTRTSWLDIPDDSPFPDHEPAVRRRLVRGF